MKPNPFLLFLFILVAGCSPNTALPAESSMLIYHTAWVIREDDELKTDLEELWRMLPDGSDTARIAATGWFGEYSPDNSQIAYSEPYDNGIWVMNADGTDPVQLTSFGSSPAWSPDGSRLAFHVGGAKGAERQIWIMEADGTDTHQLSNVNGSFPNWSPEGTKIIFHGEVNNGIWSISPDGSNETLLYRYGGYPAWSPDGSQIAYVNLEDWRIWIMDADGGNQRKLTDRTGLQPAWSPDGSQIAYESAENKKSGIFVINIDGSDDHMVMEGGFHPDWSN